MSHKVLLGIFKTAFNKVVTHTASHFTQKKYRNINRLHGKVTPIRLTEV